jgi:peroxiredoxin
MKRITTLLLLLGAASTAFAAEVGKPAPDFTATDINGKTHKLSDYRGKIVVLESYNYDCPFCRNHFTTGAMQELQTEMASQGVVWLLVNSVNPKHPNYRTKEAARKEWETLKIKATAWLDDSSGQIGRAYGMQTTPHLFVINREGVLVYEGAIDDKPTPDHDPRKARNYVRETVHALVTGKPVTVTRTKPYGCSVKYAD